MSGEEQKRVLIYDATIDAMRPIEQKDVAAMESHIYMAQLERRLILSILEGRKARHQLVGERIEWLKRGRALLLGE